MRELKYSTQSGIAVTRVVSKVPYKNGLKRLLKDLDSHRGVYLSSGYEFPGRYSRWDFASTRPPLELISRQREVQFPPLNQRGELICRMLGPVLEAHPHWDNFEMRSGGIFGVLKPM